MCSKLDYNSKFVGKNTKLEDSALKVCRKFFFFNLNNKVFKLDTNNCISVKKPPIDLC